MHSRCFRGTTLPRHLVLYPCPLPTPEPNFHSRDGTPGWETRETSITSCNTQVTHDWGKGLQNESEGTIPSASHIQTIKGQTSKLHRLYFLASRNVQHLVFNLPSKPVQGQTLNDPDKCNPVVQHPPLSCRTKSIATRWEFPRGPNGHQAGEQRDRVGEMLPSREGGRSSLPGGPLAVKCSEICVPQGRGSCRGQHSLVLYLATPGGKGWWEDRKTLCF